MWCAAVLLLFDSDSFYSVTLLDVDCRVVPLSAWPPCPVFLGLNWLEFIRVFWIVVFPTALCHLTMKFML